METIALRYFNVFGKRQDPNGAYAAVIPLWFRAMIKGDEVYINGDGKTSRDFCFIDKCVQANILAAYAVKDVAVNQVYNVAFGERTTLNELFEMIRGLVEMLCVKDNIPSPVYRDFRKGDVRHSLADISKGRDFIGYEPERSIVVGLDEAAKWYVDNI